MASAESNSTAHAQLANTLVMTALYVRRLEHHLHLNVANSVCSDREMWPFLSHGICHCPQIMHISSANRLVSSIAS